MQNLIKIGTCLILFWATPFSVITHAQSTSANKSTPVAQNNDIKQLHLLWVAYQNNLVLMDKALNSIKNELDENQKNAKIAVHTKKLEDIKNSLNRLVLTQLSANQLRQQMLEHATKYQNVYKLSAVDKPTANQISMFERLSMQTSSLYSQMQDTAKSLIQ